MTETSTTLSGFKSLGDDGWIGFFSNIFHDLDVRPDAPQGERFTLAAHEEYAAWANSDEKNLPELWFGHLPNVVMGKATAVEVVGPLIATVGRWGKDEIGQKAKAFFSDSDVEWPMSHGYKYRIGDRVAGEYQKYRTYEVTVLPPGWEANPVTAFLEDSIMAEKGLKDELTKALRGMLGISEEEAGKTVEEGMTKATAHKGKLSEGEETGQKDATDTASADVADETAADEPVGDDVLALALADALIAVQDGEEKRVKLEGEVKALKTRVDELETGVLADIKALKDEAEARKSLLPKAVAQALQQRASEKGVEVPAEEVGADAKKQAEALGEKGGADAAKDPLSWMAEQAGMSLGGKQ